MLERLEQRVLRDLIRGDDTECWLWTGHVQTQGYGQFSWPGGALVAHRAAWTVWVGPIPEGAMLCHTCDVRRCCNPSHLYVGNAQTNADDAKSRGRTTAGMRHPRRKLDAQQVAEIRARYAAGGVFQKDLAAEYGVTENQIWRIWRRRQWC